MRFRDIFACPHAYSPRLRALFKHVDKHVRAHERDDRAENNRVHRADRDGTTEKVYIAVHAVLYSLHDPRGETDRTHLAINSAETMVADKRRTVSSGQKHHNVTERAAELTYGHIRAADEAVARAYDRADRGRLTVGR